MGSTDLSHFVPALRAMGNIISTNDPSIVERCLWLGLLDKLNSLLYQSNSNIIKECLWTFSNITAGPTHHVEKFLESDTFERVLMLCDSRNIDIRKEAIFVIAHSIDSADVQMRGHLYQKTGGTLLKVMIDAANMNDMRLRLSVLDAIEDLLKLDDWLGWGRSEQSLKLVFEKLGGLDALEELTKTPNV